MKNALQWVAEAGDTTGGVGGHGWSSADSCRGRASRQRASSPAARHPRHLLGGGQGAAQQGQARLRKWRRGERWRLAASGRARNRQHRIRPTHCVPSKLTARPPQNTSHWLAAVSVSFTTSKPAAATRRGKASTWLGIPTSLVCRGVGRWANRGDVRKQRARMRGHAAVGSGEGGGKTPCSGAAVALRCPCRLPLLLTHLDDHPQRLLGLHRQRWQGQKRCCAQQRPERGCSRRLHRVRALRGGAATFGADDQCACPFLSVDISLRRPC